MKVSSHRVLRRVEMTGLSQSTHAVYTLGEKKHLIIRGVDLSTECREDSRCQFEDSLHIFTDEQIYPQIIRCYDRLRRDSDRIDLITDNGTSTQSSDIVRTGDHRILELHRNYLTTRNEFITQITEFDLNRIGSQHVEISMKMLETGRIRYGIPGGCKSRSISLTPRVKLMTLPRQSSVGVVDFRDKSTTGASEMIHSKDQSERYNSFIKANCKAYLRTLEGKIKCIDRGVIGEKSLRASPHWREIYTFQEWGKSPIPASLIDLPLTGQQSGHLRSEGSLHALSDVSPVIAIPGLHRNISYDVLGAQSMRLYDVKREQILAYVNDEYWRDAIPMYAAAMPQIVGVNVLTSQLEIIT